MKRLLLFVMLLLMVCAVAGCGDDGGGPPPLQVRQILSDETVDADVARDPATGDLTLTQVARNAVPSVFAGIDPTTLQEFRAFLDFPLISVPINALIQSAELDLFIETGTDLPPAGIPVRVELVSFRPPVLASYFDENTLPPMEVRTYTIRPVDIGHHVVLDVTPLLARAQAERLQNFQVRIVEEFGVVTPGVIEIDEISDETAPLLKVFYF
jgi:predicted small lipoprotein YifL